MSYESRSADALAAEPCRYGTSRLYVRGPKRDLNNPYLTFIGSTEVFGRFVDCSFVQTTEALLGRACVNLGSINAGIDSFLFDDSLMDVVAGADLTVVQLMDAQNLSNRFYKVHPRRNDRFLAAHPALTALYPEVDFTDFHFNKHLLTTLRDIAPGRFAEVEAHLQEVWLERMVHILERVKGHAVLLWLRQKPISERNLGPTPSMVSPRMVSVLAPKAEAVVEIATRDAEAAEDVSGMSFGPMDLPAAKRMLGPKENDRIAKLLCDRLRPLLA
ncbi:hypothetical protein TRM7557_02175 [Tritonibacter multivorans]|uniref:DUF6473 domain-containing protein n=1 Tax=Tritonibacter multivorans TaxID=928856 RepID=A0A0P1GC84_9RHOB|nr:DUF6473 family protein [Tritonibacter multivorans]MDA7421299.1 DUF6473 family protein [Tritonibacter multivorans]CUH79047.1 hypothetical protein TRM7557_02175 [Tritonibacter multivorans]SFD25791.1 hypothetical protein SAMN04488049_11010 [Tritonibacter multivorans]